MTDAVQQLAAEVSRRIAAAVAAGDLRAGVGVVEDGLPRLEALGAAARPALYQTLVVLSTMLRELCEIEAAADALERARDLVPGQPQADALRLRQALLLPPMMRSRAAIDAARSRLTRELDSLDTHALRVTDPLRDLPMLHFSLIYHGLDDRPLLEQQGRVLRAVCPSLTAAPSTGSARRPRRGRARIGFVSTHFRSHTIGRLNRGWIAALPSSEFERVLFLVEGHTDAFSEEMARTVERCVRTPRDLAAARRAILDQQLDILFFADIGMDPLSYFLAFSRMAPLQIATWGHPVTSGLPTVDAFVMSRDMEPEDGDAHFSERLIRLSRPNCVYLRPSAPPPTERRDLGLPEGTHLYLCPQAVYKFHPDFDPVLAEILRRDPEGTLALIRSKYRAWDEMLEARLAAHLDDADTRVCWLPYLDRPRYLALLAQGDVMLDPFPFCGGNTTLEALSLATPVVTLPTDHIRGRLSYAFYRTMGVLDCVAGSPEEYIEIAVRLGTDPALRARTRQRIAAHADTLFDDPTVASEIGQAMLRMAREFEAQ